MDLTIFKDGRGRPKDEIGGPRDPAVPIVLAAAPRAGVQGIRTPQDIAILGHEPVPLDMQGHGLSRTAPIVLDGQVFQPDITPPYLDRIGLEGGTFLSRCTFLAGMVPPTDARALPAFPPQGPPTLPGGDQQLHRVDP